MIKRISKKYAMTEKGAKDYVAAVFWSVLVNISKMLPVGVLAAALSGITQALTDGTNPRAGLTRFIITGILALLALFVTFLIQYRALYDATYRESANRRIRIAEVLAALIQLRRQAVLDARLIVHEVLQPVQKPAVDAGDVVDPLAGVQTVKAEGGFDDIFDHQAETEDLVRHLEHKAE